MGKFYFVVLYSLILENVLKGIVFVFYMSKYYVCRCDKEIVFFKIKINRKDKKEIDCFIFFVFRW